MSVVQRWWIAMDRCVPDQNSSRIRPITPYKAFTSTGLESLDWYSSRQNFHPEASYAFCLSRIEACLCKESRYSMWIFFSQQRVWDSALRLQNLQISGTSMANRLSQVTVNISLDFWISRFPVLEEIPLRLTGSSLYVVWQQTCLTICGRG